MITINGEPAEAESMCVADYLAREGYDAARVVVERNLEILSRESLADVIIQDGDSIEILCFVGGG